MFNHKYEIRPAFYLDAATINLVATTHNCGGCQDLDETDTRREENVETEKLTNPILETAINHHSKSYHRHPTWLTMFITNKKNIIVFLSMVTLAESSSMLRKNQLQPHQRVLEDQAAWVNEETEPPQEFRRQTKKVSNFLPPPIAIEEEEVSTSSAKSSKKNGSSKYVSKKAKGERVAEKKSKSGLEKGKSKGVSKSTAGSSVPSDEPSPVPSNRPSLAPSGQPSSVPSNSPSLAQSNQPSAAPSNGPADQPSSAPSDSPSPTPSPAPTVSVTITENLTDGSEEPQDIDSNISSWALIGSTADLMVVVTGGFLYLYQKSLSAQAQ
jgi:hypothetical protein